MKLKGRRQSDNVIDVRPKKDAFSNMARQQSEGEAHLNRQNLDRRKRRDFEGKMGSLKDAADKIMKMQKPKAAKKQGRLKKGK